MYQQFFHFSTPPFSIAPDPDFIYMSQQHQEGLAHLLYGINQGGCFVALTGEVGTGKTTLCHCLLEQLPDTVDIALVLNPKLNSNELLASICDELDIPYQDEFPMLKGLTDSLNTYLLSAHARGRKTVVLIDEAQNLSLEVLEQIRLLTNLETSKSKLLQIILVGQPELQKILETPELRQLKQRISARYHLISLSLSESEKYIKHRLNVSEGHEGIFNKGAIKKIYRLSQGTPRLINILCDRSLLGAYVAGSKTVTVPMVNTAAKEVLGSSSVFLNSQKKIFTLVAAGLAVLLITSFAGGYFFNTFPLSHQNSKGLPSVVEKVTSTAQRSLSFGPQVASKSMISKDGKQPNATSLSPSAALKLKYYISEQTLTLNQGIALLIKHAGGKDYFGLGCNMIEQSGLHCLLANGSWEDVLSLGRPAMLEFIVENSEKKYALLMGVKNGEPVFQFDEDISFSVKELMSLWGGYYMMVWSLPESRTSMLSKGISSPTVRWVRKQLLVDNPKAIIDANSVLFDQRLKEEVTRFQKQYGLIPDGIIGPETLIHLQNNDPEDHSPRLRLIR
ncbi:MAG: AAA family ATPase [Methylococcales bacterium]|nr:AAA family ATPase [Methylococcales bacterium]